MTGAWAWAELSLYEVAGAWVASSLRPSAKIYFDACSQHHAWRAQLWQQLLPAQVLPFGAVRAGAGPGALEASAAATSTAGPATGVVRPFSDGAREMMDGSAAWIRTSRAWVHIAGWCCLAPLLATAPGYDGAQNLPTGRSPGRWASPWPMRPTIGNAAPPLCFGIWMPLAGRTRWSLLQRRRARWSDCLWAKAWSRAASGQ